MGKLGFFPFYKEEYLGELPFGYSNKKSALRFMRDIPYSKGFEGRRCQ